MFAREVSPPARPPAEDLPWLVFLQGGPGRPRRGRPAGRPGWTGRCDDYRVLLLDQRGTGRSTPVNRRTLAGLGPPQAQAEYLRTSGPTRSCADAELIRRRAHRRRAVERARAELRRILHGDLPVAGAGGAARGVHHRRAARPGASADEVYRRDLSEGGARRTRRTTRATRRTCERARRIARHLAAGDVRLPGGAPLTVRGVPVARPACSGASTGSHELHYLLEDAFDGRRARRRLPVPGGAAADLRGRAAVRRCCTRRATRRARPTGWAAQRVRAEFGEFDPAAAPTATPAAVYRRDDLPLDVRERPGARAAGARPREMLAAARRLAAAVRPGAAGGQRGSRRGRRLLRRHVRAAQLSVRDRGARSGACGAG